RLQRQSASASLEARRTAHQLQRQFLRFLQRPEKRTDALPAALYPLAADRRATVSTSPRSSREYCRVLRTTPPTISVTTTLASDVSEMRSSLPKNSTF